jgi:hypothetical protein
VTQELPDFVTSRSRVTRSATKQARDTVRRVGRAPACPSDAMSVLGFQARCCRVVENHELDSRLWRQGLRRVSATNTSRRRRRSPSGTTPHMSASWLAMPHCAWICPEPLIPSASEKSPPLFRLSDGGPAPRPPALGAQGKGPLGLQDASRAGPDTEPQSATPTQGRGADRPSCLSSRADGRAPAGAQ